MRSDTRGVSEVLGYILVLSIVLASITVVSTVGLGQIEEIRDVEQMNNAEAAFDLLATNLEDISQRGAPSRSTEMQLATGELALPSPISIRFKGLDGGTVAFNESYSIRPIEYRGTGSDRTVVYAGGAIFRTNGDSGTTVKSPSIIAADDRLSVPIIHTRAPNRVSTSGGTARLRATHSQTVLLESDTTDTYERVFMNVTSPRARHWNETLSAYDEFSCSLDESGPVDQAECHADDPALLNIVLVQIDVEISD